jgi:hypothetical protein
LRVGVDTPAGRQRVDQEQAPPACRVRGDRQQPRPLGIVIGRRDPEHGAVGGNVDLNVLVGVADGIGDHFAGQQYGQLVGIVAVPQGQHVGYEAAGARRTGRLDGQLQMSPAD